MGSAAAYHYRKGDLLRRYPEADMYRECRTDKNRDQALCIMNFRSFSMFDQADRIPVSRRTAGRRSSRSSGHHKSRRPVNHTVHKSSVKKLPSAKAETRSGSAAAAYVRSAQTQSTRAANSGGAASANSAKSPQKVITAGKLSVIAFVFIMLLTFSFILKAFMMSGTDVHAGIPLSEVKYKVVEINYGDTLWSIARNNMNPGYNNVNDYISDIMDCNQMTSDRLTTGGYLMLPYYEYEEDDTL